VCSHEEKRKIKLKEFFGRKKSKILIENNLLAFKTMKKENL